jgi:hypothetical protein
VAISIHLIIVFVFPENDGHICDKLNSLDEALENVLSVGQKSTNTPSVKASSLVPSSSLHHNGIVSNISSYIRSDFKGIQGWGGGGLAVCT